VGPDRQGRRLRLSPRSGKEQGAAMSEPLMAPCPFCGTEIPPQSKRDVGPGGDVRFFVYCPNCGSRGPIRMYNPGAVEAWNRREALATQPEAWEPVCTLNGCNAPDGPCVEDMYGNRGWMDCRHMTKLTRTQPGEGEAIKSGNICLAQNGRFCCSLKARHAGRHCDEKENHHAWTWDVPTPKSSEADTGDFDPKFDASEIK
jgi:Lar family restriction alleviation protein